MGREITHADMRSVIRIISRMIRIASRRCRITERARMKKILKVKSEAYSSPGSHGPVLINIGAGDMDERREKDPEGAGLFQEQFPVSDHGGEAVGVISFFISRGVCLAGPEGASQAQLQEICAFSPVPCDLMWDHHPTGKRDHAGTDGSFQKAGGFYPENTGIFTGENDAVTTQRDTDTVLAGEEAGGGFLLLSVRLRDDSHSGYHYEQQDV